MKFNKKLFGLLLSLLLVSTLFSACNPAGGEVTTTTEAVTDPATETAAPVEETTAYETEEETTAEVTTEDVPETTEEITETTAPPAPVEVKVYVYDALGNAHELIITSTTLPSSALESVDMTVSDDVRATLLGWEYSITKDGERKPYDTSVPPIVTYEGMHVYPVIEYSYRVRFSAGIGSFESGIEPLFYITEGESFKVADLFSTMPYRSDDEVYTYKFRGFVHNGKEYGIGDSIEVASSMDFEAVYDKEELIYTIELSTEIGELIGGGQQQTFVGNYFDAVKLVESYNLYTSEDVYFHDANHEFLGITIDKVGREWKLVLNWTHIDIRFTVTFDYGEGNPSLISQITAGGKVIIPIGERFCDAERYYEFVGWRDSEGQLYNGGFELTVNENMTLYAEYAPGERRVYTVSFETDIGFFADGTQTVVLTGYYGDPITVPELLDVAIGEVVYKFSGWSSEVPAVFGEDMKLTALYLTEKQVYYINYYIDGDLYLTEPHYAGTALSLPEIPEIPEGWIFSGFIGVPEAMPEANVDIYAETRLPKVFYILDGEEISVQEVKAGTLVALAYPAQKAGYTVSGWVTENIESFVDSGFIMPASDVIFSAVSSPNKHTVKYILDGVEIYCDNVVFGELYTVRGIEVRLGYDFSGWKRGDIDSEASGGIFSVPDEDIVFFAEFKICSYKVNYYLDEELIYCDEFYFGETVALRSGEEQAGCTFAWNSASVDISSGVFLMPAGDVDIYGAFSAGDNSMIFMIDGYEYGRIGVVSGQTVDLGMMPTKYGYSFTGWSCDEVDVSSGVFTMPEGDIVLRGSFIPNAHDIFFIDIATGNVINTSHLDYSARFSLVDRIFCMAGKVSDGWILLAGHALRENDEYIMPDCDVIFGIVWDECLTIEIDEDYHIPYYALLYDEYGGVSYDEATGTVYISERSIKAYGSSEGISVVYLYEEKQ